MSFGPVIISPMREVDVTELKELIKEGITLLDLWTRTCIPCKALEPRLEELSREYEGRVKFLRLSLDKYPEVGIEYGVLSVPTVLVFRDGKLVETLVGALPKEKYRKVLEKLL